MKEAEQLNAYRLERDLTWEGLAFDMRTRGIVIPSRTLYYLVKENPSVDRVRELTLGKIRKFLALIDAPRPAPKARRRVRRVRRPSA